MKKLLITLGILGMTFTSVYAKDNFMPPPPDRNNPNMRAEQQAREQAFDKRLGLTEAQKAQSKEIRKKGFNKIKPVMDELNVKKMELEVAQSSRFKSQQDNEKIARLEREITTLERKAHAIRQENMKEFESILTEEQKTTLKQMKQEGRKNYQEKHPPFQGPRPN